MNSVAIVDTGVANIRSLQAAFDRIDPGSWFLTHDPAKIESARFCVLPGVGTFGAAIEMLDKRELRQTIIDRIEGDRPTLAICLGMQLLCESSEESPGLRGLGIVHETITRFDSSVQVPQLGWNRVEPQSPGPFACGEAYFANSFRLARPPQGWNHALTEYGGSFVSSIWRGQTLACQFHPELSGAWGTELIQNWYEGKTAQNQCGADAC